MGVLVVHRSLRIRGREEIKKRVVVVYIVNVVSRCSCRFVTAWYVREWSCRQS